MCRMDLAYVVYLVVFLYRLIFVPFVDFKSIISSVVARSNRICACFDETSLSFESDMPFSLYSLCAQLATSFRLRLLASHLQLK